MKIKITEKLICIPPYLSATWEQVASLHSEESGYGEAMLLLIHMKDGQEVRIPDLDPSLIDIAFSAHLKHLEQKGEQPPSQEQPNPSQTFGAILQQLTGMSPDQVSGMPIHLGITGIGLEGVEDVMQHNPQKAEAPDMPQEVIEKISGMAQMVMNGDLTAFPKPEPHCNCLHCQIARAVHGMEKQEGPQELEESVSEEDLKFRTWDVEPAGENLFKVLNPLDTDEHYTVFLGDPIGCTCGQEHCEHIKAALYS